MIVRIATCRPLPEPDPDEAPLVEALRARGLDARVAAWDDPRETWEGGLTVIRSTWDYHYRIESFLEWVELAAARSKLFNSPRIVRFSSHKRYLIALERAGFAVTPTVLLERGARASLERVLRERAWSDVVVKPAVSCASYRTERFREGDVSAGQAHLDSLLRDRDVLVQPYLDSTESYGERAVVWIDGAVTHSVRKSPRFGSGKEEVSAALEPAPDERAFAEAIVKHVAGGEDLLYARVDLARDTANKPVLMELELIEPSLFLVQEPRALERLVRGIVARAR